MSRQGGMRVGMPPDLKVIAEGMIKASMGIARRAHRAADLLQLHVPTVLGSWLGARAVRW
ncbi:hypothetical protein [Streptomyces sp. NPDC002550]